MNKKLVCFILAFCMIVGVLPVSAAAYTGSCGTNVTYSLNTSTGVLTISGTGAMKDYGDYYNYAPWYSNRSYIKSVTISYGVTSIGSHAFKDCTSLKSVTISDSVISMGEGAFEACISLTSVTIPDSVTSIGDSAFYWSRNLTSVTIGDSVTSIGSDAFSGCSLTSVEIPDSVTSIGDSAFSGCYDLTSVTIGNSVKSIGEWAFNDCSSLTEIVVDKNNAYYCSVDGVLFNKGKTTLVQYPMRKTNTTYAIPDSVTSIGYYAFSGCSDLTSVTIGDHVKSIGSYAFLGCRSLTSVTIGNSVTSIGSFAFEACGSLTDVYYNGTEENWNAISINSGNDCLANANIHIILLSGECGENVTFMLEGDGTLTISGTGDMGIYMEGFNSYAPWYNYRSYIKSVTISDGVTSIGMEAFYNCYSLTSVTIPDSVTRIRNSAFKDCYRLTSVTIPDSVTIIEGLAFYGCRGLTNVTIGDNVTSIGYNAFCGCDRLTSVTIGSSVTSIGEKAFKDCYSLTSVTIPDSVTSMGSEAFRDCIRLTSVTIGGSVTSIKDSAFDGCSSLTDVYYNGTIVEWAGISIDSFGNECLINATLHTEPLTGECGENATFKLENDGTLTISGTGAMADYAASADVPWAEYAESITKIVIEDGVTTVGARAFYGLSNVTEVQIAESVTAINTNAFRNCTSLTEISLPAGVTEFGTYAFSGCSALARVDMSSKVEKIGNFAFYNCKALTDVYFDGTYDTWADVSIGSFNTGLTNATIHVKAAATVTVDGVSADYNTIADAIAAADEAGKAVDIKLLVAAGEIAVEPEYAHTIDLNGYTVGTFTVTGDVKLTNGTVTMLNVDGIVKCENVTVTDTNAAASGTAGTKSVYTSYDLGVSIVEGAQVRVGGGLVDGKIDAGSGLRFIGQANMSDTLASLIMSEQYANGKYTDGFGIGIEIGAGDSDVKAYIEALKWQDDSVFTAAITGLVASNFNRNYTARCYVEYDGVKLFEENSTTRSMYAVASGLLINNKAATEKLLNVLNAYVNQTGVRLTLTKNNEFSARMTGSGAYTGEAFFTVGETMYEEGMYMVTLAPIGQAKIDVDLFNSYVRINNNNSLVSPATFIMDNEDGTYTIVFDYSSL